MAMAGPSEVDPPTNYVQPPTAGGASVPLAVRLALGFTVETSDK